MKIRRTGQIMERALRLIPSKVRALIPRQLRAPLEPYQAEVHSADQWDQEYVNGRWDHLGNVSEFSCFSIVGGYCAFLKPDGFILEVGCGPGLLMRRLRKIGYANYCGVDQSKKA